MSRKRIYIFSLTAFFLMWGVYGFVATVPGGEPVLQATALPEENTMITAGVTPDAAIPVTGESQADIGILFVYLLLGLGALFVLLASLNAANRTTLPYVRRRRPPDES
jgi:hypothetical protein